MLNPKFVARMKHFIQGNLPVIAILLLTLAVIACKKEEQNFIPQTAVDFTININNPQYISLKSIGGWVYVSGGSKGIILYRAEENNINAFDRHSTYKPENNCRVMVDSSDIAAIDTCSNSRYLLSSGNPISGPATFPLFAYETTFNGTELHVFN